MVGSKYPQAAAALSEFGDRTLIRLLHRIGRAATATIHWLARGHSAYLADSVDEHSRALRRIPWFRPVFPGFPHVISAKGQMVLARRFFLWL
jgi:hypothetical protein